MTAPTLVILAAGMGSRYGGLKQVDPMGPNGETVLDYSVYDAIRAGFSKVVFVIRRDFYEVFRDKVGAKFADRIEVAYGFQDLKDLPDGFGVPEGREKPWGTAHAVRAARHEVDAPFAVINADDFYGRDAFARLAAHFAAAEDAPELATCMVGYPLENTLSENGSVNRGICLVENGHLQTVEEHTDISRGSDGSITGINLAGETVPLAADAPVSMNFWGFTPAIFPSLEDAFTRFLEAHGGELKSESYIPSVIDELIREEQTECDVLPTTGAWFGVTYPDDKPAVQAAIQGLIEAGEYPAEL